MIPIHYILSTTTALCLCNYTANFSRGTLAINLYMTVISYATYTLLHINSKKKKKEKRKKDDVGSKLKTTHLTTLNAKFGTTSRLHTSKIL